MTRRLSLLLLGIVLLAPSQALAQAIQTDVHRNAQADLQTVEQINAYFNNLTHLQGRFTQADPDGRQSQGVFFLQRPGRLRFEYVPEGSLLVVANGDWVNVIEGKFRKEVQRYPVDQTPLAFLLKDNINIFDDAELLGLRRESDKIILHLGIKNASQHGEITFVFDYPVLRMRQWILSDLQGRRTIVTLSDLTTGIPVHERLFFVEIPKRPVRIDR